MNTYPSNQIETEMSFNVSPKIFRQTLNQALFINTSGFKPFVLIVAPNFFSQVWWKQSMVHPLLRVSPLDAHLFKSDC